MKIYNLLYRCWFKGYRLDRNLAFSPHDLQQSRWPWSHGRNKVLVSSPMHTLLNHEKLQPLIALLMQWLQTGHNLAFSAQDPQQTRWPHGRNTVVTSASMQTLHVLAAFSRSFSNINIPSSSGTARNTSHINHSSQAINQLVKKLFIGKATLQQTPRVKRH